MMDRQELKSRESESEATPDPELLLDEWLGELDILTGGLDTVRLRGSAELKTEMSAPRIDSYRFSMLNLEETQDADLDAILGELSALETQCEREINRVTVNKRDSGRGRTDSPDNDSAFSDTVSMLSSESSASSGAGQGRNLGTACTDPAKAEKIRLALEKMREASVKKLFIKAFTADGCSKSLLVDETMTCGYVTQLLADKNHVRMDPKWALVEHLPDLHMERVYEDYEPLVDNLLLWTPDSKNKVLFVERPEKTRLFTESGWLLSESAAGEPRSEALLEELFGSGVPHVEGPLYLKADGRKGWKRYSFVLRASGLYYWPKAKGSGTGELVCLVTFDQCHAYRGINWRKKHKAPTEHCFALKHPRLQQSKAAKYIKFLCAEDGEQLERWLAGIRVVKHGRRLLDDYRSLLDDLAQRDMDSLRSCSLGSTGRHSRASSSSSSGCLSDTAPSDNAFDSEFSTGTIKRKPSMKPSLPLTSITRQLKEVGETRDTECSSPSYGSPMHSPALSPLAHASYTSTGTLTRRHSKRRSSGATDDSSSGSGTLKRQHLKSPRTPASPEIIPRSMTDSITSLPPPPPPPNCAELDIDDIDSFPPPPDALTSSTLSLDSLPPPPPLADLTGSQLSLASLPPPPPPACIRREDSITPTSPVSSPVRRVSFSIGNERNTSTGPRSVSFNLDKSPQRMRFPMPVVIPPPKRLAESTSAPPAAFLRDLQKVMRKKWQVAQKCKLEPAASPHEVLGFRDYREANVCSWLNEHYGTGSCPGPRTNRPPPPPPPPRADTTHLTTTTVSNRCSSS